MSKFGSEQEPFKFNEIEIVEEVDEQIPIQHEIEDYLEKNLDGTMGTTSSPRNPSQEATPRYFSSIPFEQLTRRERRKILRMERKAQRKKFYYEYKAEKRRIKAALKAERRKLLREKPPRYHWAFFLSLSLIGLGLSFLADGPVPLFIGIGLGFLFFVGPIYEKVMQIIQDF